MPIVRPVDPSRPLEQGDLLADIETARTAMDRPLELKRRPFVLVLSRPCNALRDDHVIVAPVVEGQYPDLKAAETPEDLVRVFKRLRDGNDRPDGFYLGPLSPGSSSRYIAKLDELYTIEVPRPADDRDRFLTAHRRYRLDPEFARDLHLRVFRAFAAMGFDDVAWWTDEDLQLVVERCNAWVTSKEREIQTCASEFEARRGLLAASGTEGKAKGQHREEIARLEKERRNLLAQYEPERAEWERRVSRRAGGLQG